MSDAFKPLLAASPAPAAPADLFRMKVLPASAAPASFQPIAAACGKPPAENAPAEPQVSLVRDGDRIIAIRVRCRCGDVMELECVY